MGRRTFDLWRDLAVAIPAFMVGALVVAVAASPTSFELDKRVPVTDVASLIVGMAALALAPRYLARFERRTAFDRDALRKHLEPAREHVLAVEDRLLSLTSDHLGDAERAPFVASLRMLRTNIERASRIAERWSWPQSFTEELQHAAGLASQANRIVTGGQPFTRLADANSTLRLLHDLLLDLLRELA